MYKILLLAFALVFTISNAQADIKLKSLAKKKWTLVESDSFTIISDMPAKKTVLTAKQLEDYRGFTELWLSYKRTDKAKAKMVLFITEKSSTWKSLGLDENYVSISSFYNESSSPILFVNVKGFFGNSFSKANSGRSVVLNSIANSVFRDIGLDSKYPVWFRTGFAYYLATYTEPKNQIMLGSVEAYQNRLTSVTNSRINGPIQFNIESLFLKKKKPKRGPGISNKGWLKKINKFYMQSFLTVHYLYSSDDLRIKMFKYVNAVAKGKSEEIAMQEVFSQSFTEFEKSLKNYINGHSMTARIMIKEQVKKLMPVISAPKIEKIDNSRFFKEFTKAVLSLSDSTISSQDKQSYFEEYKQKYRPRPEVTL